MVFSHVYTKQYAVYIDKLSLEPAGLELGIFQSKVDRAAIWANSSRRNSKLGSYTETTKSWNLYFEFFELKVFFGLC